MSSMKLRNAICTALVVPGLMTSILLAHHSVTKEFDPAKSTTIHGVITKMEWMNPHSWIILKAKSGNGVATSWHVEIASATGLLRTRGIRPEDLALAQSCSMEIWPARDGSRTAYGRTLTFADGRSLDIHNSLFDPVPPGASGK